jgi:hypothetical protein
MSPRLKRAIGLTAVPALALTTLAALPTAPANAAEVDPAPLEAGSAWLVDQVTDGLVHNNQFDFDDYGLSIDVALGLDAAGGHDETVQEVADAIATNLDFYVGYDYFPVPEEGELRHVLAGSIAKAMVFAQTAGRDETSYGGHDLVTELEDQVVETGPALGRIQDTFNPDVQFEADFSNTFGQLYAAQGLDAAGSTLAGPVTEFLLDQQCAEGFFRQDFAAIDAPDQTCDGDDGAQSSTDVTALAVLALLPQADDTDVQAAIDAAIGWLVDVQAADGSFGSGADIPTPNTNSSGLAGWALGETEETAAAEKAAAWVRGRQVDEPAPCVTELNDQQGAIAYDHAALAAGRTDGLTVELEDQWRRASAQALPALQWAPSVGSGPVKPIKTSGFFQAGTKVTLGADGFAPGDAVCFRLGGQGVGVGNAGLNGQALLRVSLPDGSRTRTYLSSTGEAEGQPLSFRVLDAKTLPVEVRSRVARGGTQVVKINGLADGEKYRVTYRGKKVGAGKAGDQGRATVRFGVGQKVGKTKVVVLGEFKNRRAAKAFTVTR